MLVWVASYPRSGNTLALLTIRDVFGVKELGRVVADDLDLGNVVRQAPDRSAYRVPSELHGLRGEDLLEAIRDRPEPFYIKTHRLAEAADAAPALVVVRDGRDANISYAHLIGSRRPHPAPERLPPGRKGPYLAEEQYRELPFNRRLGKLIAPGIPDYGHWSRSVRRWRNRAAPTALLRYEDLVSDPAGALATGCAEIGVPLPAQEGELSSFSSLHEGDSRFFRRGIVGAWRDEMVPRLQERFWRIHGQEMQALDYERE